MVNLEPGAIMNWDTRSDTGWEEQLYPDAEEDEDGVEELSTE